ncbi:MAG: hypothetical protein E7478_06200 [Ruminococcaceae bacterium]|nr:hypothetical protein [Oscillospiraceae bacterium]
MTARSSTGNFSKFGTYFLYKLRTLRPLIILTSIFSLLSYPMLFGFLVPYMHVTEKMDNFPRSEQEWESGSFYRDPDYIRLSDTVDVLEGLLAMSAVICVLMLAAIFFMSFVVTRKNFRWLYNKTVVDMDYSLPISDDTRIIGDLLSTMSATLVPHLLAIGIGRVILMFRPKMENYQEFEDIIFGSGLFGQVTFSGLFACIMLMAYVLFVIAICGRKAETGLYPLVITVAVPVIHAVCLWLAYSDVYGVQFASSFSDFNSISYTSPLGFLFMSFAYAVDFMGEIEEFALPLFRAAYGIPAVIITIGLFVAAYFLIKNRRAERVGQPFAFGIVKFMIPAIVIFTVVSPFMGIIGELRKEEAEYSYTTHYEGLIIAMIIITFVLYVVMELISGKGFRRFHITLVKYIATLGISVLICVGLWNAHGFGIANYVPDAEDVQSVTFSINNYNVSSSYFDSEVSELENIEAIIKVHDELPKERMTDMHDRYISLCYNMKNGEYIDRQYYLTREQYNEWINALLTPEAYYNRLLRHYMHDWDGNETITSLENVVTGAEFDVQIPGEEFLAAYKNDCYNASFDDLYGSTLHTYTEFIIRYKDPDYSYSYGGNFEFRTWMTETTALLAKHGVTLSAASNDNEVTYSRYKTAFLVEYSSTSNTYFDIMPAFLMCGDSSVSEAEITDYGYSSHIVHSDDLSDDELYGDMYGYNSNDDGTDMYVVDFHCVKLDMDDAEFDTLMSHCSDDVSIAYNEEKLYSVVLVSSADAAEYLNGKDYDERQYFVTEEYYSQAEQLFAQLAA